MTFKAWNAVLTYPPMFYKIQNEFCTSNFIHSPCCLHLCSSTESSDRHFLKNVLSMFPFKQSLIYLLCSYQLILSLTDLLTSFSRHSLQAPISLSLAGVLLFSSQEVQFLQLHLSFFLQIRRQLLQRTTIFLLSPRSPSKLCLICSYVVLSNFRGPMHAGISFI